MKPTLLVLAVLSLAACSAPSQKTAEHHYQLSGRVVSLNAKDQTASIDAAAVPNFMEAMTMDYPIASKSEFQSLHAGDRITGVIDMGADGGYTLSHIQKVPSAKR